MSDFTENAKQLWRDTLDHFGVDGTKFEKVAGRVIGLVTADIKSVARAVAIVAKFIAIIFLLPRRLFALIMTKNQERLTDGAIPIGEHIRRSWNEFDVVGEFLLWVKNVAKLTAAMMVVLAVIVPIEAFRMGYNAKSRETPPATATQYVETITRPIPTVEPWKGISQDDFRKKTGISEPNFTIIPSLEFVRMERFSAWKNLNELQQLGCCMRVIEAIETDLDDDEIRELSRHLCKTARNIDLKRDMTIFEAFRGFNEVSKFIENNAQK